MRSLCRGRTRLFAGFVNRLLFLFFFPACCSVAQNSLNTFSPGARAIGLGHTGVVDVYDATALYWNPAGLGINRAQQGILSIHEPFKVNYLGYAHFVPKLGSFAMSLSSTLSESEQESVQSASIGWGHQVIHGLSVGLNVNGLEQAQQTWGAFGVGILLKPTRSIQHPQNPYNILHSPYIADRFTLGFTIQNIPLGQQNYDHQVRLGASYKFLRYGPTLVVAHHFMPNDYSDHLGLIITPTPHVQIFAGIKNYAVSNFSFGGGFEWDNIAVHLVYDEMSKRLAFSTIVRIGPHPKQIADNHYTRALDALKRRNKKEAFRQCEYSLIYDENHKKSYNLEKLLVPLISTEQLKIDSLLMTAQTFQNQRNYLGVAAQYLKILKIDAKNREAQDAIAMIRPKVNVDAERWYLQAVQAYNENNIKRAEEIFESIILVRPDHFGSKSYLKKIQTFYSKQAEQRYFAGLGYYSQRKLDLAENEFRKALQIDPAYQDASDYIIKISNERVRNRNQISTLLDQAQRMENNQAWQSALSNYKKILQIQPDHTRALQKSLELEKEISDIVERYYNRGVRAYKDGDTQKAIESFNTALVIDPTHTAAQRYKTNISTKNSGRTRGYIERAQNLLNDENWQAALTTADSALAINPNLAEAKAVKATATDKLDAETLVRQARVEYLNGRYLRAIELLEKVLEKAPTDEARDLYENSQLELNSKVDNLFNKGIQLYTEENYKKAINAWDSVLRINPYHKGALDYKDKAQQRLDVIESLP